MELTKKDTKMIQGLSVLAMVCLHLFNREYEGLFQPLIFIKGIPLSFYFSLLSDFCVMGFAACSGYGHMSRFGKEGYYKHRLKALIPLICNYWLILVLFSLVSVIVGTGNSMPGTIKTFVMNALFLENSYNGAWWYMFSYILLVLISPVILKCVRKYNPWIVLVISFGIYCVAYYVRFYLPESNWILGKLGPFGMTLFEYVLGAICYEKKVLSRIYKVWKKMNSWMRNMLSVFLFAVMLFGRTLVVPSLFVAPVTGTVIIVLFHLWKKPKWAERIFEIMGMHSTNIWLTHMFFYLVIFENLVYIAKYPILIFAFMIAITLGVSVVLKSIMKLLKLSK